MENTGRFPKEVSADAGYYSDKNNIEFLEKKDIEVFIPPDKVRHSEWRTQKAIRGPMQKEELNLRQFLLRGLEKVRPMWRLTCAANIWEMFRVGISFDTVEELTRGLLRHPPKPYRTLSANSSRGGQGVVFKAISHTGC
ncbi:MAG: hypothetical protein HPY90_13425 [Syntrophothermus sp.]|uniref:hypothetical protein n=1 Tax=Syntrophothermus sp. TaxID=2736299 RepID=UPI00257A37A7|nr:hypothetical protein [Syntrophothermus sp.]NSW84247.1 hypothetical protein [Syntrophothermus sp.]